MHGQGNFYDPRLDDEERFPIAARHRLGHIRVDEDLVTPKLPALHFYQIALAPPTPPPGSFDAEAAARGGELFRGQAQCTNCHFEGIYSEAGWPIHRGSDIGIDEFQASRSPEGGYRTPSLRGLFSHMEGGFYHDGRFPTLMDVVRHYDAFFGLGLTDVQSRELVEFLKSL
jgi:cytochrome c peroxidase